MNSPITERQRCIDRGPAWRVACTAFIVMAMHYGIFAHGALFYPALTELMDKPIGVISWLMTGQFAVTFCLAPVYNRLLNMVANRVVSCTAALVTSAGIAIAAFTNNYLAFCICYSLVAGVGLGVTIVRVIAITAEYFDRYRVLALAFCTSGAGFGTVVYTRIASFMIEQYTWRVALVGFALLHLNMIPLCLLLRPLPSEEPAEPMVVLPDHPDLATPAELISGMLSASSFSMAGRGEPGKLEPPGSTFISLLSVQSAQSAAISRIHSGRGHVGSEMRSTFGAKDLRVVIEFVKASRDARAPSQVVVMDSSTVILDPRPGLLEQIREAGRQVLMAESGATLDSVLVPVVFISGEAELLPVVDALTRGSIRPIRGDVGSIDCVTSQGDVITGLSPAVNPPDATPYVRQVPMFDSFTSSVVSASDQRQTQQSIKEIINKAEATVGELVIKLTARGLSVVPKPILVIVDQVEESALKLEANYGSDDRFCVLGYFGPEDETIMEVEEEDNELEPSARRHRNSGSDAAAVNSQLAVNSCQAIPQASRRPKYATALKAGQQLTASGAIVPQRTNSITRLPRMSGEFNQSRDMFTSMTSVHEPNEAVKILVSKVESEQVKIEAEIGERQGLVMEREPPKYILTDLCYLSFLVSRLATYLMDSTIFAHISNYALSLGFDGNKASQLFSYIGVTGMLGRLFSGFLGQFTERVEIRLLSAVCSVLLAAYTFVMSYYSSQFSSYVSLTLYAASYGILVSPTFAFSPAMAIQIVGMSRFDEAVAYILQFEAIGYLVGAPISGAIKEIRNQYADAFLFASVCSLITAAILFIHSGIHKRLYNLLLRRLMKRFRLKAGQSKMDNLKGVRPQPSDEIKPMRKSYEGDSIAASLV